MVPCSSAEAEFPLSFHYVFPRHLKMPPDFILFELQTHVQQHQRSLNVSIAHARLQQSPIGPHFFGTICSVLMYLPSLSRQTTSIWLSAPCSNSLYLRSVQCLCLAPFLNTHRTTAFAVFVGNTLPLFWTIPIILGLAALICASDRLKVCVSVAASSTNRWEAF